MKIEKLHRHQDYKFRVFILCWVAYASAYLCRTNLSIILPSMKEEFQWNNAVVGMIGTSFFWCYAIGQLVNGYLGDRVNPRYFIPVGLMGASIINLLVGAFPNLYILLVLWSMNGFLLATIWGPIVRIMAAWFPKKERTKVAVGLNLSMMGGYLLSWGLVGIVINYTSFRWGFFLPGIFTFLYSLVFLLLMRAKPNEVGYCDYSNEGQVGAEEEKLTNFKKISLGFLIFKERLWLIAITCIVQGLIKEGITLWIPTFLNDNYALKDTQITLIATIVPFVSISGIFLAGYLNTYFQGKEKKPLLILFSLAMFCSVLLYVYLGRSIFFDVSLFSLLSALMYGVNMLLLTMLPFRYAVYNKASGVTGFLDFCSYLGAGLSGVITGIIVDTFGWSVIMLLFSSLSILGIISILTGCQERKDGVKQGKECKKTA